jgi:hypothetical protein
MNKTRTVTNKATRHRPVSSCGARAPHGSWSVKALLPEQFFIPAQDSHAAWTGERRLMLAVLQEALHTYLKYSHSCTRRGRRLAEEVRQWFWARESAGLYTFECICQHLHLDPAYLRQGLLHWPRQADEYLKRVRAAPRRATSVSEAKMRSLVA